MFDAWQSSYYIMQCVLQWQCIVSVMNALAIFLLCIRYSSFLLRSWTCFAKTTKGKLFQLWGILISDAKYRDMSWSRDRLETDFSGLGLGLNGLENSGLDLVSSGLELGHEPWGLEPPPVNLILFLREFFGTFPHTSMQFISTFFRCENFETNSLPYEPVYQNVKWLPPPRTKLLDDVEKLPHCFCGQAIQWDQRECCTIKPEVRSPSL